MTDIEIVKKGYLKNHVRSATSSKDFKPLWFVFKIGSSTSGHILDIFNTEKGSSKKNPVPRDRIYLREIQSVYAMRQDNPSQFCLTSIDGAIQYTLEASSELECNEWVFALNAVLFGKGFNGRNLIQFAIHINKCSQFSYHGYGILEVREDALIVWSQGESEEVVRWKLGHLRSFKAKVGVLEIIAGSRSSTGEGVFMFSTQQSVLITHTLETVIDRLARLKRLKNMKLQQALPPLPYSNDLSPTSPFSPSSSVPGPFFPSSSTIVSSNPNAPGNIVTLVRGRTDTTNRIPNFCDIPDSVKVSTPLDQPPQRQHKSSVPCGLMSTYDKLHNADVHKTVSAGSLSLPRRDIYASDVEDTQSIRRTSHMSMKGFDYSYVETDPKCVIVSPTQSKHSIGFGEVRHSSTSHLDSNNSSSQPMVITSDYYDEDSTYSSLNPVNLTSELPQGLYNQLDFKPETRDQEVIDESSPLPPIHSPLPIHSPATSKGYVNVGSGSSRTSDGSRGGLSDSVGSLEFTLEGSDSPKIMKKCNSPKPSPRQSPCQSPSIAPRHTTYKHGTSSGYSRVSRDENKQNSKMFDIDMTSVGEYSKLTARSQKEEIAKPRASKICSHETDDDNPYAQLSRNQKVPTNTSHSDYDQLCTSRVSDDSDDGGYSKFSHSTHASFNKISVQYQSDAYSTLQTPDVPDSLDNLMINGNNPGAFQRYEEIQSPQSACRAAVSVPLPHISYEEIQPTKSKVLQLHINHYDDVPSHGEVTTNGKGFSGSLIYEDDPPGIYTDPNPSPSSHNVMQPTSLDIPPLPPQRGASTKRTNYKPPPPPPPVKPKPYVPKR